MKKASSIVTDEDGHRYDLSKGVRGRFAHLVGCGSFRLWPELHPQFETGEQVDAALREWVADHRPPRQDQRARLDLSASSRRFVNKDTHLVRGFWFARDLVPYFPTEKSVNEALRAWVAEHKKRKQRVRA
jgi:hypothetical protein